MPAIPAKIALLCGTIKLLATINENEKTTLELVHSPTVKKLIFHLHLLLEKIKGSPFESVAKFSSVVLKLMP